MNDFEIMWRNKIKCNIELEKDHVLSELFINNKEEDPVVYSRKLISDLKDVLIDERIKHIFSESACHMPPSKIENIKKVYELTGSLKLAHDALQRQFEMDIKSYKQLSDNDLENIIRKGWGAAGIYKEDSIIATKIPSRFHEYFKETDPLKKAFYYCHCPRIRKELLENRDLDSIYCYCGGGFYKDIWQKITSKPVRITVLKNLFDGNEVCQFKIEIKGHHINNKEDLSMKKTLETPVPLLHPAPIAIVGSLYNNSPNFTTIGDIAVAGLNPPLIMISLHQNHACTEYINTYHKFSVNIPTINLLKEVDFAGIYSGKVRDKSILFNVEYCDEIPVIKDAPIQLIVREEKRVQIEHRVILVCRVQRTIVNDEFVSSGSLNLTNLKTILYGLDNQYYTVDDSIGTGYVEGRK